MPSFVAQLNIDRGSTFRKRYEWRVGPRKGPQVPVDLTGCTATTVFTSPSGEVIQTLTTENGGMTLGGTLGTIAYYISHTDTATWGHETCEFVTTITFTNGDVYRKIRGTAYAPEV